MRTLNSISSLLSAVGLPARYAGKGVLLVAVLTAGVAAGAVAPAVMGQDDATPVASDVLVPDCGAIAPGVGAEPFTRTELFFGTTRPDDSTVTDEEWNAFLDEEITPRFPAGLTVLMGDGQFENASGEIIEEESIVLILLYPVDDTGKSSDLIEEIRDAYETAFEQESVLRADGGVPVCASF